VTSLAEYDGALIAGGFFTHAEDQPASRIARWNGSSWSPLGQGMDYVVLALRAGETDLIAGGAFLWSGGVLVNHIAQWNPASPAGACCRPDRTCYLSTQADCGFPNAWQGSESACEPNPCPEVGACCDSQGACQLTFETNCAGIWMGAGAFCDPNPCPQPGVCCTPSGQCQLTFEMNCDLPDLWFGEWESCQPNPCDQPAGACCYPDGQCFMVSQADCPYDWRGAIPCDPNPCPPCRPCGEGACCYADGTCAFVYDWDCNGQWIGYGIPCEVNPCPTSGIADQLGMPGPPFVAVVPNPANGPTTVWFRAPEGVGARLEVFDATGRLITQLASGPAASGTQSIKWDGRSAAGESVPTGMYFVRLTIPPSHKTCSFVVVR
jgi:hypothetical protein